MSSKAKTRIPPCPFCGVVYANATVGVGTSCDIRWMHIYTQPETSLLDLAKRLRLRKARFMIMHPDHRVCETLYVANDSKKAKQFYAYRDALEKEARSARSQ